MPYISQCRLASFPLNVSTGLGVLVNDGDSVKYIDIYYGIEILVDDHAYVQSMPEGSIQV